MKGPGSSPFLFVALRYLLGRAREGGRYLRGAAAAIALSLIPIMVTLLVADGMIRGITDRYLELGTGHLEAYDFLEYGGVERWAEDLREDPQPGIRGAWCERQGPGILLGKGGRTAALVRAVEPGFLSDPGSAAFLRVIEGSAAFQSDRDVLLGQGLAEASGASPGSTVRLMTVRTGEDGTSIPRVTVFTVRGIISSGYRELDSLWCLVPYSTGRELLSAELYRSFLMVKIDDPYHGADLAAASLSDRFGQGSGVYAWKRLQQSLYRSFESTRQMLLFIMAILVIVAAVNVSSSTSMLAIERQRDIAVLKAGGTGPGGVRNIFLWASFLTGLSGALAGSAAGLLIGRFINQIIHGLEKILSLLSSPWNREGITILDPGYYLAEIPIIIDWRMVAVIIVFTVICSVIASYIPARRAGKQKPLEILRKI